MAAGVPAGATTPVNVSATKSGSPPSIMAMQDFWSGKYFNFVEKKVPREQLFDLNVAKEAQARLEKEKPFGN